jgi:hypothetical protein
LDTEVLAVLMELFDSAVAAAKESEEPDVQPDAPAGTPGSFS